MRPATLDVRLASVVRDALQHLGLGFDQVIALGREAGAGLMNMRDRLDAVGGRVTITSEAGRGTTVSAVGPGADHGG